MQNTSISVSATLPPWYLLLPISIEGLERLSFSVSPFDEVKSVEFFLCGVVPCVMFKRSSE